MNIFIPQFDSDTEGLRAEKRSLEERLAKRDSMLLEQHNRIVLLESAVASVKEERNCFVQSMDEVTSDGLNNSGGRAQRSTRFGAAKKVGGAGGTLSSIRQVRRCGVVKQVCLLFKKSLLMTNRLKRGITSNAMSVVKQISDIQIHAYIRAILIPSFDAQISIQCCLGHS